MASIFGGYFDAVQRGIEQSEDRYEQKRLKNLELWRQFQADAIAEGREVSVDEYRSFLDQLSDGSSYLRGFLPADKILQVLKARQDERIKIRKQEEVAASLARRQQANSFFESTLANAILQQEDDAKAAETFLGSFQTPQEQELARGFLQSRNLAEIRDQIYTQKVTELMPHVQGMRPDMIKAMFGKQLPGPVLDALMKREQDRQEQEAAARYRQNKILARQELGTLITSNPYVAKYLATGDDETGFGASIIAGIANTYEIRPGDLMTEGKGLATVLYQADLAKRVETFVTEAKGNKDLMETINRYGGLDDARSRAALETFARSYGLSVDALTPEVLAPIATYLEALGTDQQMTAVSEQRAAAHAAGLKAAETAIEENYKLSEAYAGYLENDAQKAALNVAAQRNYIHDHDAVIAVIKESGTIAPEQEQALIASGALEPRDVYRARATDEYVRTVAPPVPVPKESVTAANDQLVTEYGGFASRDWVAEGLTQERFEIVRASVLKELATAIHYNEQMLLYPKAYFGLSEDTIPQVGAQLDLLRVLYGQIAAMPVPSGLKSEVDVAQEEAAKVNVPLPGQPYAPPAGSITAEVVAEINKPTPPNYKEQRFTDNRVAFESTMDVEARAIAALPPEQRDAVIDEVAERLPKMTGFDTRYVKRRLREKVKRLTQ